LKDQNSSVGLDGAPDDEEILRFLEASKPRIILVGAGGSGCNTLNRMVEVGVAGATFVAMNTDARHLLKTRADKKILLGKKITRGMGAGSNPKVGEKAAEESLEDIKRIVQEASMVFVTCGLGGGTGTGSAPLIARAAKEAGALTVAVVTLPFNSEGTVRRKNALDGLQKLKSTVDTIIVIPNEKLLNIVPDLPLDTAFKVADEVLTSASKGIVELVTKAGLVNLDFADLYTILKDGGAAVVGLGESGQETKPSERAILAIENALVNPLLEIELSKGNRALVNVVGGEDMTLKEAEMMVKEVASRINSDSHIIWGARIDRDMPRNILKVLVVIAGAELPEYSMDELTRREIELDIDMVA